MGILALLDKKLLLIRRIFNYIDNSLLYIASFNYGGILLYGSRGLLGAADIC